MKQAEIEAIASEYDIILLSHGDILIARYKGKETDLMHRRTAYHMSWEYWHATFRKITGQPALANYWTSSPQQQDKLRQNAVTTRCVTRRIQG